MVLSKSKRRGQHTAAPCCSLHLPQPVSSPKSSLSPHFHFLSHSQASSGIRSLTLLIWPPFYHPSSCHHPSDFTPRRPTLETKSMVNYCESLPFQVHSYLAGYSVDHMITKSTPEDPQELFWKLSGMDQCSRFIFGFSCSSSWMNDISTDSDSFRKEYLESNSRDLGNWHNDTVLA